MNQAGMISYARAMSSYNRWMNARLYEACAALSDEDRKRDVGAFFGSIHGTLNHQTHHRGQVTALLSERGIDPGVTDRLWLPEFQEVN